MPAIPPRRARADEGFSTNSLQPHWATDDGKSVRLYHGHVLDVLRRLPERSVHCVMTSPPYWGLRSYLEAGHKDKRLELGSEKTPDCEQLQDAGNGLFRKSNCAERDWAAGCFVCRMVLVFREVRRVLRDDGVLWLNFGDSYSSGSGGDATKSPKQMSNRGTVIPPRGACKGVQSGNLMGVPWRVALAMQADGWILRQDVIWQKPAPMPESIRSRCTKSHEYVFMFAKRMGYYFDQDAIREESKAPWNSHKGFVASKARTAERLQMSDADVDKMLTQFAFNTEHDDEDQTGRNKRSVWTIGVKGWPGCHFATFPEELVKVCVLASTSEKGCCGRCGAPWRRSVETNVDMENSIAAKHPQWLQEYQGKASLPESYHKKSVSSLYASSLTKVRRTTGWEPTCACKSPESIVPCSVLDPFAGTATTCITSLALGRASVGIDLSARYLDENAVPRVVGRLRALGRVEQIPHVKRAPVAMVGQNSGAKIHTQRGLK